MSLTRRTVTLFFFGLLVLSQPLVFAQEARWKELREQVEQLTKQGKYDEAPPLAQEAIKVAEDIFGPEHLKHLCCRDWKP